MTKEEIKHINWMYNRLTSVHKENPNLDYMMRFKEIIDQQLTLTDVGNRRELLSDLIDFSNNNAPPIIQKGLKQVILEFNQSLNCA